MDLKGPSLTLCNNFPLCSWVLNNTQQSTARRWEFNWEHLTYLLTSLKKRVVGVYLSTRRFPGSRAAVTFLVPSLVKGQVGKYPPSEHIVSLLGRVLVEGPVLRCLVTHSLHVQSSPLMRQM